MSLAAALTLSACGGADSGGQPAPTPDMAAVPIATYRYNPATTGEPAMTFTMNGETVDFIPMMPSHTAGDTIVRFRNANAIYIEDFYRNFGYPYADQANGGSIKGMLEAIDLIEKLAGADTTLIPGHGTLVKKTDLLAYRAMLHGTPVRSAVILQAVDNSFTDVVLLGGASFDFGEGPCCLAWLPAP